MPATCSNTHKFHAKSIRLQAREKRRCAGDLSGDGAQEQLRRTGRVRATWQSARPAPGCSLTRLVPSKGTDPQQSAPCQGLCQPAVQTRGLVDKTVKTTTSQCCRTPATSRAPGPAWNTSLALLRGCGALARRVSAATPGQKARQRARSAQNRTRNRPGGKKLRHPALASSS